MGGAIAFTLSNPMLSIICSSIKILYYNDHIKINEIGFVINKIVTHSGSNIWRVLQGLSTETVYLRHSTNAEDTILAGRSAASPKAPPYGSL